MTVNLECRVCGCTDDFTQRVKGIHTGLYCRRCGAWVKWIKVPKADSAPVIRNPSKDPDPLNCPAADSLSENISDIIKKMQAGARLYRFSGYVLSEHPSPFSLKDKIEGVKVRLQGYMLGVRQLHIEESEPFAFSEQSPEADENCDLSILASHFPAPVVSEYARPVEVGAIYRHFKGHRVKVLHVAKDTETAGALHVIYQHIGTGEIWTRPYSMFVSPVDREKYPDAAQEYRFELE